MPNMPIPLFKFCNIFVVSEVEDRNSFCFPVLALLNISCCESQDFHSEKKVPLMLFTFHRKIDNLDPK